MSVFVHDGLFTAEPRLLGSRCDDCGGHHFPRHETCPYCSSSAVHPVELSPTGTLWSWTAVTAAPPGYEGDVPFGFGVVELPEGVRIITRLTESDPTALHLDQQMRLVLVPLANDIVTYAFEAR
jgi:uncharacterized OB-fold protein